MRYQAAVAATVFTLLGSPAVAQIFKCTDDRGEVSFQDISCDAGVKVAPSASTGSPRGLRESEQRWLKQRQKQVAGKRKSGSARSTKRKDRLRQEKACWKKQQQLNDVRARLRRGYKPAQGEKLRRLRRAYEDYLFRYCD